MLLSIFMIRTAQHRKVMSRLRFGQRMVVRYAAQQANLMGVFRLEDYRPVIMLRKQNYRITQSNIMMMPMEGEQLHRFRLPNLLTPARLILCLNRVGQSLAQFTMRTAQQRLAGVGSTLMERLNQSSGRPVRIVMALT